MDLAISLESVRVCSLGLLQHLSSGSVVLSTYFLESENLGFCSTTDKAHLRGYSWFYEETETQASEKCSREAADSGYAVKWLQEYNRGE